MKNNYYFILSRCSIEVNSSARGGHDCFLPELSCGNDEQNENDEDFIKEQKTAQQPIN